MPKLFNTRRIEEASTFIAAELSKVLNRNDIHSYMSERISKDCPTYQAGLTCGETVVATLRALAIVQDEIIKDLTSLNWGEDDEDIYDQPSAVLTEAEVIELVERKNRDQHPSS